MMSQATPPGCESSDYYVGATIDDRYLLLDFVGEGGMACVFKAREPHAPHLYALKFLKRNFLDEGYVIEFFEREAHHMRDLSHPNIVRFYDFVQHPSYAYIVMDYVDGFSLVMLLRNIAQKSIALPLDETVRILTQVARSLDRIHRAGLIHRDVKPGNILIRRSDGTVFLTDLGITVSGSERQTMAIGTRAYMSPEQQMNLPLDHRTDVYAFGVLAFELLAGRRPYMPRRGLKGDEAERDVAQKHLGSPVPRLSAFKRGLPPALDDILSKALAKQPEERYDTVLDLARDIHAVLRPELSEELQQFEEIRAITPPAEVLATGAGGAGRMRLLLGVVMVLLVIGIALIVLAGTNAPAVTVPSVTAIALGSAELTASSTAQGGVPATQTSTETVTPVPVQPTTQIPSPVPPSATATATDTATATATSTPTASFTPTFTLTPSITPSPAPTAFLDNELLFNFLEGGAALANSVPPGAPIVVDNSDGPLVRLNVGPVNGFRVEIALSDQPGNTTDYGIAYRVQDAQNYLLFRIDVDELAWLLQEVRNGTAATLQNGTLEGQDIRRLVVSGKGRFFRIEVGTLLIQDVNDRWATGGVALWIGGAVPSNLTMDRLVVGLLGDEAIAAARQTPTPASVVDPRVALLRDVRAMLNTGDNASSTIDCPLYITIYETLDRHEAEAPPVPALARRVKLAGELIYERCRSESPDAKLAFNTTLADFLEWQSALTQLEAELQAPRD